MAENADIVRRAFDAFSRRDLSALLAISDPEIEFMPATARVAGRGEPYRGHEGLRTYLADVARVWQELRSEPAEFIEVDDIVVCTGPRLRLGRRARHRRAGGLGVAPARRQARRGPRLREPARGAGRRGAGGGAGSRVGSRHDA